jgi:hypothetical protein
MQNVRISKIKSENNKLTPYYSSNEHCGPLAMKQHANRLQKFNSMNMDEFDKSSYTASTYCSNFQIAENRSDFEGNVFSDEEMPVDELIKQQQELMELQNSVQMSLKMIQKRLKQGKNYGSNKSGKTNKCKKSEKKTASFARTKNNNLTRTSTVSMYNSTAKTPEKVDGEPIQSLHKPRGTVGMSDYQNRAMGRSFTRVVATPNKVDDGSSSFSRNDISVRRTRAMRTTCNSKEPTKSSNVTPSKINNYNARCTKKVRESSSYISYHPKHVKRSHTPMMAGKRKKEMSQRNNISICEKVPVKETCDQSASTSVHENLRLKLLKSSRQVSLKHLNNL